MTSWESTPGADGSDDDELPPSPFLTPLTRLRDTVEADRLDIAALIWMLCLAVYLYAAVDTAWRHSSNNVDYGVSHAWTRVLALSTTASLSLVVAIVAGLAIAAAIESPMSRGAASIGAALGLWVMACGFMTIAFDTIPEGVPHRVRDVAPSVMIGLAIAVLGSLVTAAGWRLATTVPFDADDEEDADEEDAETV